MPLASRNNARRIEVFMENIMETKQKHSVHSTGRGNFLLFTIVTLVGMSFFIAGLSGCEKRKEAKVIKLEEKAPLEVKKRVSEEKPIRIAVGSMITPKEGFAYYHHLLSYIGEKLGRPAKYIDKDNYEKTNALLKSSEIDVAFVCGRPYVDGHDEFGLELLVAPQSYNETVYYSYLIVPFDSPVKSFEDLRGKRFAFTDPKSNSGKLVPTFVLAKMHETPDSFFKKYLFTYAHDKSIEAVAHKIVDGAAVDSLIWEYLNRTDPKFTSKTKIIWKSPPYGIPPVVVPSNLNAQTKSRLKEIFLNIHKDEKGKRILKGLMIDKFVLGNDGAYDSIRAMKDWVTQLEENIR